MTPQGSTHRCRSTVCACLLPPPMKPRPVGSSPPPLITALVGNSPVPSLSAIERTAILMSLAFFHPPTPKTRRHEGRQMNVGPGITGTFPVLTDEQVASVARRGTRHHTAAGEVLYAGGDRGYDFVVIEAGGGAAPAR